MNITFHADLAGIDWPALKSDLAADHFDNGRTPAQLEQSFRNSHSTCITRAGGKVIGTARVLSDGVCVEQPTGLSMVIGEWLVHTVSGVDPTA